MSVGYSGNKLAAYRNAARNGCFEGVHQTMDDMTQPIDCSDHQEVSASRTLLGKIELRSRHKSELSAAICGKFVALPIYAR